MNSRVTLNLNILDDRKQKAGIFDQTKDIKLSIWPKHLGIKFTDK